MIEALQQRRADVDRLMAISDSLTKEAKDLAAWSDNLKMRSMEDDRPEAPSQLKAMLKVSTAHFTRLVSLGRAVAQYESRQFAALRAERIALDEHVSAGTALKVAAKVPPN